ncbi:MAG: hypothetical protein HOP03_17920 [Lysobacter sp.]|nr:hypothetical protein [Lysobacter sp.]
MSLRTWSKRVVLGLLGVVFLVAAAWATSRLLGPTDAQETALETMREPLPALERNAFAALWLMPYDVPASEREAAFADDRRRIEAMQREPMQPGPEVHPNRSADANDAAGLAAGRYPAAIAEEEFERFCKSSEDCLKRVDADLDGYAALIERNAALLDRVEALEEYDGLHQAFGLRFDSPMPAYQYGTLVRTRHAVWYRQGRTMDALDRTCRAITTWRRLAANSDTLVSRLIGVSYAGDAYARQFAQMLVDMPRDAALPASCAQAFALPAGQETSICRAMRGEFTFMYSSIAIAREDRTLFSSRMSKLLSPLLFSEEMTAASLAEPLAFYCRADTLRAMADDVPITSPEAPQGYARLECLSNMYGCVLGGIASPDFDDYAAQAMDANARLRLIAALLRMRADTADTRPFPERLKAAAGDTGLGNRRVDIGPDGRSLQLQNHRSGQAHWDIPLPAYFHTPAAASR